MDKTGESIVRKGRAKRVHGEKINLGTEGFVDTALEGGSVICVALTMTFSRHKGVLESWSSLFSRLAEIIKKVASILCLCDIRTFITS